jgi:hypothetical protein
MVKKVPSKKISATNRAPSDDDKKNSYLGRKYNNFINSYVSQKEGSSAEKTPGGDQFN